jgi:hypothetical protein
MLSFEAREEVAEFVSDHRYVLVITQNFSTFTGQQYYVYI